MTANTGSVLVAPRWSPGQQFTSLGTVTFSGSATTGDTGTIAKMTPEVNGFTVVDMQVWGTKLDAHASAPTATLKAGDGTDDDFYFSGLAGTVDVAAAQLLLKGTNSAGIGSGTTPASNSVVLTLGGTVATAANGAVLYVSVTYICNDAQN
jgi:hypothetical protein